MSSQTQPPRLSWAAGRNRTRAIVSASVLTVAAVAQIVLTALLYDPDQASELVTNIGWLVLWSSAAFGVLPILTLRRWGRVPQGQAYVHTTVLVDRGIYGIVRHPQYLAGILLGIGLSLVAQHWAVAALGAIVALASYADTFDEERNSRQKFGPAYDAYCRQVPRVDPVTGLVRYVRRSRRRALVGSPRRRRR